MAVLTVDVGGTPISLNCTRGGHAAPRTIGPKTTGNSGTEESSVRAELMVVPIVTDPISLATAASLRTKFAIGNQVPCSGDIFNTPGTITFSGAITDELRETADSVILNLTLSEVGTDLAVEGSGGSTTTTFVFTDADDPDDPTAKTAEQDPTGSVSGVCYKVLPDAVLATCAGPGACPVTFSDEPERVYLGPAFAEAGFLTGTPVGKLVTKSAAGGGAFSTQSSKIRIYLVRGGTDPTTDAVFGPLDSAYKAGPFDGDLVTFPYSTSIVWPYEAGDRLRFEIWSRAGLNAGATDPGVGSPDDLGRQTICDGGTTGVTFRNVSVLTI